MDNIGMNLNQQDENESGQKKEILRNFPLLKSLSHTLAEKNLNGSKLKVEEDQLLKKKRESNAVLEKSSLDSGENRSGGTQARNGELEKCQICARQEWHDFGSKVVCKICNLNFHSQCLIAMGEVFSPRDLTCFKCRKAGNMMMTKNRNQDNQATDDKSRQNLNMSKLPKNNDKNINLFNYLPLASHQQNMSAQLGYGHHPNLNSVNPLLNLMGQQELMGGLPPQTNMTNQLIQSYLKMNEKSSFGLNSQSGFNAPNLNLGNNQMLMTQLLLKSIMGANQGHPLISLNTMNPNMAHPNPTPVTNVNLINNLINCVNYQNFQKESRENVNRNNSIPNFLNNSTSNLSHLNKILTNLQQQTNQNKTSQGSTTGQVEVVEKPVLVEDLELKKNPDLYGIDIECFERPEFIKLVTPEKYQSKILLIWDYLLTFGSVFWTEYSLYSSTKNDVDKIYEYLVDQRMVFFRDLTIFLLTPFFSYAMSVPSEEFTLHKELLIMRTLKENINTDPQIIIKRTWLEIVRILINSKKFSLLTDDKMIQISKKIFENTKLNFEDKLDTIVFIINSSFDLPSVKDYINREMYKKNEILREKSLIQNEYKMKDLRKKEIEKNDKFLQAENKIDIISRKLSELEKNSNSIPSSSFLKKKKEYQIEIEKYRSLLKEYDDIQVVKEKILTRLKEIKNLLNNFPATSKRSIGHDIDMNEYLYFEGSSRIYVKIKKSKNLFEYRYYSDMQDIEDLANNKLIEKGLREKNLKRNLLKVLPRIISQAKEENKIQEEAEEFHDDNLLPAVEILKKLDEKFSEYLTLYSKQWEDPTTRSHWIEIITKNQSLENLAPSLIMLNLRFKNPYRSDESGISDTEDIQMTNIDIPSYNFISQQEKLVIFEYDQRKILAPKVKIWSKDLEVYEIEKYFGDNLLNDMNCPSKFYLALHFYESVIFSLIKRREAIGKKSSNLIREINDLEMYNEAPSEASQPDQEKTVSLPEADVEKTESINPSAQSSEKKTKIEKKPVKNNPQTTSTVRVMKRKRNVLNSTKWSETCYICGEYGDLLCCDGCPRVAHLFCVCLEVNPDQWFCEHCLDKKDKNKKKIK